MPQLRPHLTVEPAPETILRAYDNLFIFTTVERLMPLLEPGELRCRPRGGYVSVRVGAYRLSGGDQFIEPGPAGGGAGFWAGTPPDV
ncbi:MAG: hypothetical protein U0401_28660 [Anaerolineae bacterium]